MRAPIVYDLDTGRRMHARPGPARHTDVGGVLHGDGRPAVQGRVTGQAEHDGDVQPVALEKPPKDSKES